LRKLFSIILIQVLLISGCSSKENKWEFGTKTFLNQYNKPFNLKKELEGEIWIANFIFTECNTVCLPMTANFEKLAKMTKENKLKVKFISFSVDPNTDSPDALSKFSSNYNANDYNWNFLTSYSQEFIEKFAMEKFQMYVKKPKNNISNISEGHNQVIHGTSFILINKKGEIVDTYAGVQNVQFEEIINKIKEIN
jgi:protein SCO1/2